MHAARYTSSALAAARGVNDAGPISTAVKTAYLESRIRSPAADRVPRTAYHTASTPLKAISSEIAPAPRARSSTLAPARAIHEAAIDNDRIDRARTTTRVGW